MRTFRRIVLVATVCAIILPFAANANAEESYVPTAIEQIPDSVLRDALIQYKPNYNVVSRSEQVVAYVNIYQAVHGGQPPLSPQDATTLSWGQQQLYQPAPTYYYDPYDYWDDSPYYYDTGFPSFFGSVWLGGSRPHRPGPGPGWGGGHRPPPGGPGWGGGRPPHGGGPGGRPPGGGPGGRPPGGGPGGRPPGGGPGHGGGPGGGPRPR